MPRPKWAALGLIVKNPENFFMIISLWEPSLWRRRAWVVLKNLWRWAPSAPIQSSRRFLLKKRICGTDIRKKPMRHMALQKKCPWCKHRPIARSTGVIFFFYFFERCKNNITILQKTVKSKKTKAGPEKKKKKKKKKTKLMTPLGGGI